MDELNRMMRLLLCQQRENAVASRAGASVSDEEFAEILAVILRAMGGEVWQAHELLQRAIRGDENGVALAAKLGHMSGGANGGARSIGIFLARRVREASYVASNGIEIRRCGKDGNRVCWTVAIV